MGIATPAFAQPPQPTAATPAPESDQATIVTGTRISNPNLSSTSPVTILNNADVHLQGTTRTEDLINSLPQAFAGQGGNISNGSSGTATVNLRGLGSSRTLVGADAVSGVVNFIMDTHFTGLRMDAQYSFYQHDNRASTQITQELDRRNFGYPRGEVADGGTYDLSLALGAALPDGRGHVMAYATYRQLDPVLQGRRATTIGTAAST